MKILNCGCGKDTFGTDFIDAYPSRPEVKKVDMNKDKFPYPSNTFNLVYARQVFAHLTNHKHFLSEARRVLKRNGTLIITTDSAGFYGTFRGTHHGDYDKLASQGELDKAFALFTPQHLLNWLELSGFKNCTARYTFLELPREDSRLYMIRYFMQGVAWINKNFTPNIIARGEK